MLTLKQSSRDTRPFAPVARYCSGPGSLLKSKFKSAGITAINWPFWPIYGCSDSHEEWRWQPGKHADKERAITQAEGLSESRLFPERDKARLPQTNDRGEKNSIREIWRSSDIEQRFGGGQHAPRVRGNVVIGESSEGFHTRIEATQERHVPGAGWQKVPMQERWSVAMPNQQEAMQAAKIDLRDFNRFWAERAGKEPWENAVAMRDALYGGGQVPRGEETRTESAARESAAKERVKAIFDRIGQSNPTPSGRAQIKEGPNHSRQMER